ncbi:uncharacterized protein G2W53_001134 [Senna tora]|uniref:Uncharacterized protein n=1 Tax=Senna tora TaxID=362788 RepID=A0A835CJ55_9FABA|nr:uncharacterized protein G2W53_001134 [Senna tora]
MLGSRRCCANCQALVAGVPSSLRRRAKLSPSACQALAVGVPSSRRRRAKLTPSVSARVSSSSDHLSSPRIATGKEPSFLELFLKTHKKKDSGEFVDKRSTDVVSSSWLNPNNGHEIK